VPSAFLDAGRRPGQPPLPSGCWSSTTTTSTGSVCCACWPARRWDVDAKQADSSASALHLLREYDFDCIMLDNQLGDASGADLLPTFQRESRRPCP
jgi:CheY-like chemotaxis protein